MKTTFNQFFLLLTNINKTHLLFIFMLITLVMLVLGAAILEGSGSRGLPSILFAGDSVPGGTGG
jgi:hypothetical protein